MQKYAETGANASGTAMEKYDIVLEGVAAKQEQLNAKVQEFWSNLLSDEFLSGLIEIGKGFMDVMNFADGLIGKILLLGTAILVCNAAIKTLQGTQLATFFVNLIAPIQSYIQYVISCTTMLHGMTGASMLACGALTVLNSILNVIKAHPIIFALSAFLAITIALQKAVNECTVTTEEWDEKLKETKQSLADLKEEATTLNDELKTTKERIAELEGKDSLTLTEEEELQRLKQQNSELQRQIELNKIAQKQAQKENNKTFVNTMQSDVGTSAEFDTTNQYGDGYAYGSEQQYIHEQFEKLKTATDKEYDEIAKYLDGKYKEFAERAKDIEYIPNPTTEDEKAVNAWLDYINEFNDKYLIALGDTDSINTLWNDIFTRDKFSEATQGLQDLANNGELTASKIAELYKSNDKIKEFIDYLISLGLIEFDADFIKNYDKNMDGVVDTTEAAEASTEDLEGAFDGLANQINTTTEEVESAKSSFDDLLSTADSLTEKYKALKDAQEEYNKSGKLSIDTLNDIAEAYPDMAENIGLYLAGLMTEQELFNALQNAYATDVANYETLIRSKLSTSETFYNNILSAESDEIAKLAEAYGVDFSNYKTVEEAKLAFNAKVISELAKRWQEYAGMSAEQLEQESAALEAMAEKQYRHGYTNGNAYQRKAAIDEALGKMKNFSADFDKIAFDSVSFDPVDIKDLNGSGSSKSGSSSSKEWWETQLQKLKDQLEYNQISMDTYINGVEKILGKLKKGSDAWNKVNAELQKAKLENVENQFDRGEITIDQYIKKLTNLRKAYKKNSEGYKELTQKINDAKLEDTENWIDKLQKDIDDIDDKINRIGEVNTAKEQVKYADLLSDKYKKINSTISTIQKRLKQGNLTTEQRVALQEYLNELLEEEVSIRDEIEDSVQTYYENQKEYLEQQAEAQKKEILYNKEIELYGKKGKELFEWETNKKIKAIEDEIDLRQKEREALDEVNEREQLTNDLLEARLQLQNALNNKTTKILKKQADGTWQYEYSANMNDVKSAQEAVKDAEKALDDFDWEQGIQELQDEADRLSDEMERLADAYEETDFFANREYEQTMNSIAQTFGDIDKLVQDWMGKYGSNINTLTTAYEKLTSSNATLEQSMTQLATIIESKFETVGNNGKITPQSFDTGGQIIGNGLAFVHDKERVLTAEQNAYFEKLVSTLPSLAKLADVTKFSNVTMNKMNGLKGGLNTSSTTTIQKVECVFPNISTTDGLQKAILDLPRLALQKK